MYVCATMCGCVWRHERVQLAAPLVLSGYSDAPLWSQVQLHEDILSFPCWQQSLLFLSIRTEKAEHLMWTCHTDFTHSDFNWRRRTFLPQFWELLRALLFPLTGPCLIWTKKAWWSPLEVLCGYDVTSEYILLFGQLQRSLLYTGGVFKGTAVLTQSVACNISLVIDCHIVTLHRFFFPGQNGVLVIWGHMSLKVHWFKLIWTVLLVHCCHVMAVHHFYNLC